MIAICPYCKSVIDADSNICPVCGGVIWGDNDFLEQLDENDNDLFDYEAIKDGFEYDDLDDYYDEMDDLDEGDDFDMEFDDFDFDF